MKSILITGATKGIGRACAECFSTRGWRVTAVARTEADLTELARHPLIEAAVADLSTEAGVAATPRRNYDVVLLNAAAYAPGTLLGKQDVFTDLFALNVLGNHRLARRLLPEMIKRNQGHLVAIGSTGTDHWKGHMTAYVASKYALRGLFYGWQEELASTRVQCTLVAPGATLTSSWADEEPPEDILPPERVAEVVWGVVREGTGGRVTVP